MDNAKRWADFLQKEPPYSLYEISREDFWFLSGEFEIKMDSFCDKCGKERVFTCYNKEGIKSIRNEMVINTSQPMQINTKPYESMEHFVDLEFICSYCDNIHHIPIKVTVGNVMKYGQYPSYAREKTYEVVKYKNIISKYYTELTRAINLYSQKCGIAAFVHLRRIFEYLIDKKYEKYVGSPAGIKFKEKLNKVEKNEQVIPQELNTEKNMIYKILSKGIHEYEEDECYSLYPALEYIIKSILDIELEKKQRKKELDEVRRKINSKRMEEKEEG